MAHLIGRKYIHPQLRLRGSLMRAVMPGMRSIRRCRVMNKMQAVLMAGHWKSDISDCREVSIPRADGSSLRMLVCTPKEKKDGVPGLLWIHGGGYSVGMPEQDRHFIDRFIKASGCAVVAPDYTLSAAKPYPAALEDCYQALLWMKEHAAELSVRDDQLFVGGDSAGGGLTAALCLYARDKGEVAIALQMPLYPMINDRMDTPSMRGNDAPVWNEAKNRAGWKAYLGPLYGSATVPAYAAPARAENLTGLPPTISFVGMIDPFFSETLDYMELLRKAGGQVWFQAYPGCYHAFDFMVPKSQPAKNANAFLMDKFSFAVKHYFAPQPDNT